MKLLPLIEKFKKIPIFGHDIYMLILISPALTVNYGLVLYFVPYIYVRYPHLFLWSSPVIIGDIIGFMINSRLFKRYYKP
jgi:hypothetical protein